MAMEWRVRLREKQRADGSVFMSKRDRKALAREQQQHAAKASELQALARGTQPPAAAAAGVKRKHPGSGAPGAPGGPAPPEKRKKGKKGKAPSAEKNAERQLVLEAYKRLKAQQKKTGAPR